MSGLVHVNKYLRQFTFAFSNGVWSLMFKFHLSLNKSQSSLWLIPYFVTACWAVCLTSNTNANFRKDGDRSPYVLFEPLHAALESILCISSYSSYPDFELSNKLKELSSQGRDTLSVLMLIKRWNLWVNHSETIRVLETPRDYSNGKSLKLHQ